LLDSIVKEQVVKSFSSTEARILQQPHFPSSCFSKFFSEESAFYSTACASDQLLAPRQREANSTAFQSAVNHLLHPLSIDPTEAPTGSNHHPVSPAHSTQLTLLCNPYFQDNQLIYKRFSERSAPEVVRIIGPAKPASTLNCTISVVAR
jgi:hypothetical protein